jgi:ATP-dependent phosphofructokinase / diphosphate-dependent phosphofructokinase
MNEIKKIGILTGGGDCSGLNAVIYAVTKTAILKYGLEVVGFMRGYSGLYHKDFIPLTLQSISGIMHTGGTILKSSNKDNLFNFRVKENGTWTHKDISQVALDNLKEMGVDALVILGGDGTLTSARDFGRRGLPVVGIPKTIDNDLPATDVTFGYNTSLESITDAIDKITTTAASHDRIMIVEVMGRNTGWLAIEGGLAGGADVILIPEIPFQIERVVEKIEERNRQGKNFSIIVVAEGAKELGGSVHVRERVEDSADQIRLGGIGGKIMSELQQRLPNQEVRYSNLAYIQRGGVTSQFDRVLGLQFGFSAIDLLMSGIYSHMVTYKDHTIKHLPLEEVVGRGETGETSEGGTKLVNPTGLLVRTAKGLGIVFGD